MAGCLLASLWSASFAWSAFAPAPDQLSWTAPVDCPSAAQVLERARRLAGPDAATSGLVVRARVEHRPARSDAPWQLELEVEGEAGTQVRSLEAQRCLALADVTALVLALGLDPFGSAGSPPSPVPAPPVPASFDPVRTVTRDPELELAVVQEPAPPGRAGSLHAGHDGVGFGLRLLAGAELGALPHGSGGGRLSAALLIRRFRFEAHGAYWLPRPARIAGAGGMGVDVRLATGGADVCVRLYARRRLELPLCAGAEVGLMRADAVGTPEPARGHGLWAAARLAPALAVRVADWAGLWVGVEGTVALARPRFHVGDTKAYTPAPAGARALAGVEMGF